MPPKLANELCHLHNVIHTAAHTQYLQTICHVSECSICVHGAIDSKFLNHISCNGFESAIGGLKHWQNWQTLAKLLSEFNSCVHGAIDSIVLKHIDVLAAIRFCAKVGTVTTATP